MHIESKDAHAVFIALKPDLADMFFDSRKKQMMAGRKAMMMLFDAVKTFARNGAPFRGHTPEDDLFSQILRLIARSENGWLQVWMGKKTDWTSGESKNEMNRIVYCEVILKMLTNISYLGGLFGIIIDETTDISNVQQTG